jgi:hypothetical protein
VHSFNFGDLTIWDRLFGTFRDTDEFAARCGFPGRQEEKLGAMLCFRDEYDERAHAIVATRQRRYSRRWAPVGPTQCAASAADRNIHEQEAHRRHRR